LTLRSHLIHCPVGGTACKVRTSLRGTVNTSARRQVKLGGSTYTLAAGKNGAVRTKLTKRGLRFLRRYRRIKATIAIEVRKGALVTAKKVKVTLRAPTRRN
jgi:hypothetical protein